MRIDVPRSTGLAVQIANVSKTFPGQRALANFSLDIPRGEVHALVGENGSGKSTLIKCLAGYHTPDEGARLKVNDEDLVIPYTAGEAAAKGLVFVHQDFGIVPQLNVMENLALGSNRWETRRGRIDWKRQEERALKVLAMLGRQDISPRQASTSLSASAQATVAIARALDSAANGARLVVLDEPTAALPEAEVQALFDLVRRLVSTGTSVLFVSHRLQEVFDIADRVTVLRDGHTVGTYRVDDLDETTLIRHIVGRELEALYPEVPDTTESERTLEVLGLTGRRVQDLSFDAHRGEILGIAGIQGSGRSELLRLLFGAQDRASGTVRLRGVEVDLASPGDGIAAGIALVPEDRRRHGIIGRMSVGENLTLLTLRRYWRHGRLGSKRERGRVEELIREFRIRPGDPDQKISRLSGGNQQKAVMAKWIETDPVLLLLDEPVQGVDVGSKSEIYHSIELLVEERGTTVVIVSSDLEDLHQLCHRVLVLREGRIAAELAGRERTAENMIKHASLAEAV